MNKQIIFTEKNVAQLCDVEKKMPGPGEVLVKMCYTAISTGTERANLTGDLFVSGASREPRVHFPRTVGYSGSGIVESVGEHVASVRPGDRVVTYWGKHKLYNTLPESNVVRIEKDHVDMKEASFIFISTFSLAAIRKVEIELGESCLWWGLGCLACLRCSMRSNRCAKGNWAKSTRWKRIWIAITRRKSVSGWAILRAA